MTNIEKIYEIYEENIQLGKTIDKQKLEIKNLSNYYNEVYEESIRLKKTIDKQKYEIECLITYATNLSEAYDDVHKKNRKLVRAVKEQNALLKEQNEYIEKIDTYNIIGIAK